MNDTKNEYKVEYGFSNIKPSRLIIGEYLKIDRDELNKLRRKQRLSEVLEKIKFFAMLILFSISFSALIHPHLFAELFIEIVNKW